ncbi:MAG TPA: hypothetical protein DCK95_10980 [Anaerolineaceae bacterium]|uniref:Uncharacterized protein n=1 Tax=Anaerolinea thermophila TaxID=167964 RepID=A0A101FXT8_9CHLR|nr:MAG: hypothetical protein XD73_0719 [Anaerolinea thermophila]HAF62830.1 hypothetical protein [Anaerolineaceae bacterium]
MADLVKGIDISDENESLDWNTVKELAIQYAFIRAYTGLKEDKKFREYWQNAASAAIWRGAVHTVLPTEDGHQQAVRFVELMNDFQMDLPAVLDASKGATLDQMNVWGERIHTGLEKKPILYISAGLWNGIEDTSGVKQYVLPKFDLWVANWQYNGLPEVPTLPRDWDAWHFWQYGKGWNYFNGDVEDLREYANIKPKLKTVTILSNFLRGRARPMYVPGQSEIIFSKGQVLQATESAMVHEAVSGITWIQVEIPSCPCCRMWVSSHPYYVKIEEKLQ